MRPSTWIRGLLLALPLVGLTAWLTVGGLSRSFGPEYEVPGTTSLGVSSLAVETVPTLSPATPSLPAGFPSDFEDYAPDTFWERVNGADEYLLSRGCLRILVFDFDDPPAELELLVFDAETGASEVLARDAGPERQEGLGDEASVSEEAIFFRRGRLYGRLYAEGDARPGPGGLAALAIRIDESLADWAEGGSP